MEIMDKLEYGGNGDGMLCGGIKLLINELAPRVHNGGHWFNCLCCY